MKSRVDKPDTRADLEIRSALDQESRPGFVVVAGAGAGKTTSLVKALDYVVSTHEMALKARTQQVACITYTDVAAREIHGDVGSNPLALVSTIHSFLWMLAKPFQVDIGKWVINRIEKNISELEGKISGYGPRVQAGTKQKDAARLEKYRSQRGLIGGVARFTYGTGSDYANGTLGHEDILSLVPELVISRPLLAKIAAQKFPFIFVDESQDTFPNVVECLKYIHSTSEGAVSLGFFGDPMQQIYQRGVGEITLEEGWIRVSKPENFRSSPRVLDIINFVRAGGDSLIQVPGRPNGGTDEGEVFFFVFPADENRTANLSLSREWLDINSVNGCWTATGPDDETKILTIVHRMAARRLGFNDLYEAFNDNGSSIGDGFIEGTAWPLRVFDEVLFPIMDADTENCSSIIDAIRRYGTLLGENLASPLVKSALADGLSAVNKIRQIAKDDPHGAVGDVLKLAVEEGLVLLDPRFAVYLEPDGLHKDVVISDSTSAVLCALMKCRIGEVRKYRNYVNRSSPYSSQHGTKGSEFDKVIVVLDDEEGRYSLYSYEKYLGLQDLSKKDLDNQRDGLDSVLERTRRLFYVCVSRAEKSLAVVLYTADVVTAVHKLKESGMVGSARVLTLEDLN